MDALERINKDQEFDLYSSQIWMSQLEKLLSENHIKVPDEL
jgi:hypothetical protein